MSKEGTWHVWQERAPQGPWFLRTPEGEDIFFGGDLESAEQCLRAVTRPQSGVQSEPVAWRVRNDFGHWHTTNDALVAETWDKIEKLEVQPLYLAALSLPVTAGREIGPCTQAELDAFEGLDSKSKQLFQMWVDRALKAEAALALSSADRGRK